jgi:hypothetical protein
MESKECTRLNGAIGVRNLQQRKREYDKETENESRDFQVEVCRRADGNARQQQCNADQCYDCARNPKFPHAWIVPDKHSAWGLWFERERCEVFSISISASDPAV